MSLSKKVVVLPKKEEMSQRLLKASQDPILINRFYPILLKSAGQEKHGVSEVVSMFIDAVAEAKSFIAALFAQHFVEVVVDDKEVAQQTKRILRKISSEYIKELKKREQSIGYAHLPLFRENSAS